MINHGVPNMWLVIGFTGQIFFFSRFLVQWLASEKAGRSVVPNLFWYLSVLGGTILTIYAFHRKDPVFLIGQFIGLFVYSRNLWLIHYKHETKNPE